MELIAKLHTSRRVRFVAHWPIESSLRSVIVVAAATGDGDRDGDGDEAAIKP